MRLWGAGIGAGRRCRRFVRALGYSGAETDGDRPTRACNTSRGRLVFSDRITAPIVAGDASWSWRETLLRSGVSAGSHVT